MWKGKPNCVCSELEWLTNYTSHIFRVKNVKSSIKFSDPFKFSYHQIHSNSLKRRNNKKIYEENVKMLKRILASGTLKQKNQKRNLKGMNNSLNFSFRSRIEQKINEENLQILSRLKNAKSSYDTRTLEKLHQQNHMFSSNISKMKSILVIKS